MKHSPVVYKVSLSSAEMYIKHINIGPLLEAVLYKGTLLFMFKVNCLLNFSLAFCTFLCNQKKKLLKFCR